MAIELLPREELPAWVIIKFLGLGISSSDVENWNYSTTDPCEVVIHLVIGNSIVLNSNPGSAASRSTPSLPGNSH